MFPLPASDLTGTPEWAALQRHYESMRQVHLRELFDGRRGSRHAPHARGRGAVPRLLQAPGHRRDAAASGRACRTLRAPERIDAMFAGEHINTTEDRAVLHVAFERRAASTIETGGHDVVPTCTRCSTGWRTFADQVRSGEWLGATGQAHHAVVNIGIGGSDLGPAMAYEALGDFTLAGAGVPLRQQRRRRRRFRGARDLDPAKTLFIVSSKTFTTVETITNAKTCRSWLVDALGDRAVVEHFVAVSTNADEVEASASIPRICSDSGTGSAAATPFDSAIGLSLMIAIGPAHFARCSPASTPSTSTCGSTPFERNLPVLMGLLGIWYIDFFGAQTQAVLPYSAYLTTLTNYLQQLDMEINGKSVDLDGNRVELRHRAGRLGHPGHQRPARLLPADPPGHPADPGRLHRLHRAAPRARGPPRPADGQPLRPDRGAGVRQDARAGRGRGHRRRRRCPHRVFEGNHPTSTILAAAPDPVRARSDHRDVRAQGAAPRA